MPKNWTITLTSSSVSIQETSASTQTIFAAPLGVSYISLAHNNSIYDSATHSYVLLRVGAASFKLDYTADTITPAQGVNSVSAYVIKLGRYMNGDNTVVF